MKYAISVSAEPSVEPVTTAEVKTAARIDYDAEDSLIARWIKSGRQMVELETRQAFITRTLKLSMGCFPNAPFYVPRPPLQSITTFAYYGTDDTEYTLTEDTHFYNDTNKMPGRIDLVYGQTWPSTVLRSMNGVIITYKAGYGDAATSVPEWVADAIFLYCTWRNENRTGEAGSLPKAFFDIIRPHRLMNVELETS